MEYTTSDLYWEDSNISWYKTNHNNNHYYFHNDSISCWQSSNKSWSKTFYDAKGKLHDCIWKKVDEKFVRDTVKLAHYTDEWKGRTEYPHATNQHYGNQATTYESSLGKGDKKRFTLLLDKDVYDDVVSEATLKDMRRNTYLNIVIRDTIESREVSAV